MYQVSLRGAGPHLGHMNEQHEHEPYTKNSITISWRPRAPYSIGAVLSQVDDEGGERPVYFSSRKLSPAERKWPVRDKEALAILVGCQTFRHHILGSNFTVRTDHQSLQWLMDAPSGRIARWATMLAEYEPFTIIYRKGELNKVADAMSRTYAQSECLPDIAFCFASDAKRAHIYQQSTPVHYRKPEHDVELAYEEAFRESRRANARKPSNKSFRQEYNSCPKSKTKWTCETAIPFSRCRAQGTKGNPLGPCLACVSV